VGAKLILAEGQTDRQTDMTKLIIAFRNFANSSKNEESKKLEESVFRF
jgi:hypothetical protein